MREDKAAREQPKQERPNEARHESIASETSEGESGVSPARDPLSGYASAEMLGPAPGTPLSDQHGNDFRDPMSGYANADMLDRNEPDMSNAPAHDSTERDPLSGYASADMIEQDEEE